MKSRLLVLNASARRDRSITRQLTTRLAQAWLVARPAGEIVTRDIGQAPPTAINQDWIAAAYSRVPGSERHPSLAESERLIDELDSADAVIIGTPLYNFGMPAVLKLWLEQIIRVGRTFRIEVGPEGERYLPLLRPKPVFVVVAAGNPAFLRDGSLASVNFLRSHLGAVLEFLGFGDLTFIEVGEAEAKQGIVPPSLLAAENRLRRTVDDPVTARPA